MSVDAPADQLGARRLTLAQAAMLLVGARLIEEGAPLERAFL